MSCSAWNCFCLLDLIIDPGILVAFMELSPSPLDAASGEDFGSILLGNLSSAIDLGATFALMRIEALLENLSIEDKVFWLKLWRNKLNLLICLSARTYNEATDQLRSILSFSGRPLIYSYSFHLFI